MDDGNYLDVIHGRHENDGVHRLTRPFERPFAQQFLRSASEQEFVEPDWSTYGTLVANWDASDEDSISTSSNFNWTDQVNGYVLSQGTAANKPATGTRSQNGRNVIDFDGTDDYLTISPMVFAIGSQPSTLVVVSKFDDTGEHTITDKESTGSARQLLGSNAFKDYVIHGGFTFVAGDLEIDINAHVLVVIFDGANTALYEDGVQDPGISSAGQAGIDGLTVGARNNLNKFFNGWIGQLLYYSTAVGDVVDLSNQLKTKWGI